MKRKLTRGAGMIGADTVLAFHAHPRDSQQLPMAAVV